MAKIVVTGDKQVDRALRALGPKVANGVVVKAMRKGMKRIKAEVEARAPDGSTGDLESSVKLKAGTRSRGAKTFQVFLSSLVFDGVKFYAAFVEFGTADQPPQPYMRGAFDTLAISVRDEVMAEIVAGVEAEAAKG
jgi:HK97 gp10 family phage protein